LGSKQEIDLRLYGKFVTQEGLRLSGFDRDKNVVFDSSVPHDWVHFSGVDIGSGGSAHPPAIVFISASPDYKRAKVTDVWKGVMGRDYAVTDIIDRYMEMRGNKSMTGQYYDYASAEFGIIAGRTGLSFERADKHRDSGFALINSLFKNEMISIVSNEGYLDLVDEIMSLRFDSKKANDDAVDAFRYAVSSIPWNFDGVTGERMLAEERKRKMPDERTLRSRHVEKEINLNDPSVEMEAWNELMGTDIESNYGLDVDDLDTY
jgi:hypothetical protein